MFYALQVNQRNKMRWESKPTPDPKKVKEIQEALQIPQTIAMLLIQRGIEEDKRACCHQEFMIDTFSSF